MKHALLSVVVLSALSLQAGPSPGAINTERRDEDAIRRVMTDMAAAWNRHDIDSYSMLFTEDADFTNWRGTLRVRGRDEIKSTHAPLFAGMFRQSKVQVADVRIKFYAPTVAAVHCVWEMVGVVDYDGKGIIPPRTYLPLFILTKGDGKWSVESTTMCLSSRCPRGPKRRSKGL